MSSRDTLIDTIYLDLNHYRETGLDHRDDDGLDDHVGHRCSILRVTAARDGSTALPPHWNEGLVKGRGPSLLTRDDCELKQSIVKRRRVHRGDCDEGSYIDGCIHYRLDRARVRRERGDSVRARVVCVKTYTRRANCAYAEGGGRRGEFATPTPFPPSSSPPRAVRTHTGEAHPDYFCVLPPHKRGKGKLRLVEKSERGTNSPYTGVIKVEYEYRGKIMATECIENDYDARAGRR
ncbi:hypothetical protein EVAR_96057_1 [Eumeta japonica]|uniref:Uncharacterized protein n=1 Tax=Eumeta variegata TaxID=151549 RepID=A0A4C1W9B4_EUMVA|nr:hypothetical protein EVAR_96057_1 [Eumeta japonica]